jgi:hypothetical protein
MSEMNERVAQAIEDAGKEWLDKERMSYPSDNLEWSDVPSAVFARAAIEAMREPTAGMAYVGRAVSEDCATVWRDMIDEAKK